MYECMYVCVCAYIYTEGGLALIDVHDDLKGDFIKEEAL